ncbi:MAG: XRE family transcriptional regulator [Acidobacteria bacterium]|nr:XRE family transcriptional regulator [Acidobacteriota bacterium]
MEQTTARIDAVSDAIEEVEASSGNVFSDIGVADAEVVLAKAELARQIDQIIRTRGLKQVAVAKILGVDQGKVSALVRGRLAGFSTDRLLRFLNALGRDIEIVIKRKPRSSKRGHVTVVSSG